MPYSKQKKGMDEGIAVYFTWEGEQKVLACDQYNRCGCNLWAIAKTIEAMRGIDRWGCSEILSRAFTGFKALPEKSDETIRKPWWGILGVGEDCSVEAIRAAYRQLAKTHHPDVGGDHQMFVEIQEAYKEGMKHAN